MKRSQLIAKKYYIQGLTRDVIAELKEKQKVRHQHHQFLLQSQHKDHSAHYISELTVSVISCEA